MKKHTSDQMLTSAVHEGDERKPRCNSVIVSSLPENSTPEKQIEQLTSREREVLQFVAEGKLNKQAASELCISIKTIEKHRDRITKKLGIRGIAGLTHFAIYTGITECNPKMSTA